MKRHAVPADSEVRENSMKNVAVIGASGFTGLELIKMLHTHPGFQITYLGTSEGGVKLDELHPTFASVTTMDVHKLDCKEVAEVAELAFLALPHKTSMPVVRELMDLGVKVVDLSADYRLEQDTYEAYYVDHIDPDNIENAVYGLPELYRDELKNCSLVANPGCHATAAILSVLPFVNNISDGSAIFIDSKTGVSGAGKKCTETTHFCRVNENMFAYNPFAHRHAPEVKEKLKDFSDKSFEIMFVPQLVPMTRGTLISTYITLNGVVDAEAVLKEFYAGEPFVRVRNNPVETKHVAGTNFCDIYVKQKGSMLFVSVAIDNLLKGASSAAVVNANLMCGYPEDMGIPVIAYVP
jgi:N-acetyl-gamma-glutamyl-phosphate reductase